MSNTWPEKITPRTSAGWDDIVKNWNNNDNRKLVLDTLKALEIPAMTYAKMHDPAERVALIKKKQGEILGEASLSDGGGTAAKKTAAPKAAGTGTPATGAATGGGGAAVNAAAIASIQAKLDEVNERASTMETILKLILLQNPDALQLAADADVLAEIGGKSLAELAGNG